MSEWKETVIGAVCDVGDGAHSKVERQKMGVPYLTSKNFNNGSLKLDNVDFISSCDYERLFSKASKAITRPQENDILMGIIGTFGNAYKYKKEDFFGVSSSVAILRPNTSKIDPEYLKYTINSNSFKTRHNAYSGGSVQGYSNIPTIKQIPVLLPQVSTQINIVQILQSLDSKIDNLRRQNETLEEIARSIFKHWFIDFEFPNADGKPHKSSGGAMVRSDLGDIPEGWRISIIEEIAKRIAMGPFGSRITTDNFVDSGVPVIRGNNLVNGFNEDRFAYLTSEKADELKSSNVFPEDIVFTHRGTLGQLGFIPLNSKHPRYVVSQSQMLLSVNKLIASPRFIYRFLSSTTGVNALLENKNTTGVPSIAKPSTSLKAIPFILPSMEVMKDFDVIITSIDFKVDNNTKQIKILTKTRDALLPKLMSGQLRVKE